MIGLKIIEGIFFKFLKIHLKIKPQVFWEATWFFQKCFHWSYKWRRLRFFQSRKKN